ncbi:MAG TPA: hypothetical protein VLA49_18150 [Anaerolineales bacterium]|nr:hypothetical protein [Anaerolineales bacterium]
MLDELRDHIISYLSQNRVCVITTTGSQGAWATVARYDNNGLELNCRLPRWSDTIYHLENDPRTIVIITNAKSVESSWLELRGTAHITEILDDRYVTVRITPNRIDLIDESRGWGSRETLEL